MRILRFLSNQMQIAGDGRHCKPPASVVIARVPSCLDKTWYGDKAASPRIKAPLAVSGGCKSTVARSLAAAFTEVASVRCRYRCRKVMVAESQIEAALRGCVKEQRVLLQMRVAKALAQEPRSDRSETMPWSENPRNGRLDAIPTI